MLYVRDWRKNILVQQYKIMITELAEKDLEMLEDYIAFKLLSPQSAISTLNGIRNQINKLHFFPERNELDKDEVLAKLGIRMDYYKNYKIYYLISEKDNVVYIVRIIHMLADSRIWLYQTLGLE